MPIRQFEVVFSSRTTGAAFCGIKPWNGSVTLKEMTSEDVPAEIMEFVPDCPIVLVSPDNIREDGLILGEEDLKIEKTGTKIVRI